MREVGCCGRGGGWLREAGRRGWDGGSCERWGAVAGMAAVARGGGVVSGVAAGCNRRVLPLPSGCSRQALSR